MSNSGSVGTVSPFGATEEADAPAATDALNAYMQEGTLAVLAGLVVAVFLIYQFGRYFLSQSSTDHAAMPQGEVAEQVEAPPQPTPVEEEPVRVSRPWQAQQ